MEGEGGGRPPLRGCPRVREGAAWRSINLPLPPLRKEEKNELRCSEDLYRSDGTRSRLAPPPPLSCTAHWRERAGAGRGVACLHLRGNVAEAGRWSGVERNELFQSAVYFWRINFWSGLPKKG
ncbi:hypothetical protein Y1Q_0014169 [Alligator mississippiensis]|uniref:Uncharacterized protein n=1 Tax=Alligator mississippiensis TaxID=8496 RepID=A0A151MU10_ALLMI|nr:hypothetical protein Y1Q_0014169 [Alligator mississippiensis]